MKRPAAAATPVVCVLLLICVLIAPPSPLSAQVLPSPGDTIRVSTGPGQVQIGRFEGLDGDRLVLLEADGTRSEIARSDLQRMDVLVGKERQFVRRMALTMGALAAGFAVVHAASWSECITDCGGFSIMHSNSRREAFTNGAKVGGLMFGIPVGILVGMIEREYWEEGRLSGMASGASVGLRPGGGGIGFSASLPLGGAVRIR